MPMSDSKAIELAYRQDFYNAYVECALWSTQTDDGRPFDDCYSADDLSMLAIASMRSDCDEFYDANRNDILDNVSRAGHDFWLTRNCHGAGFWDGDWPADVGERLATAAKAFGECDLYVVNGEIFVF